MSILYLSMSFCRSASSRACGVRSRVRMSILYLSMSFCRSASSFFCSARAFLFSSANAFSSPQKSALRFASFFACPHSFRDILPILTSRPFSASFALLMMYSSMSDSSSPSVEYMSSSASSTDTPGASYIGIPFLSSGIFGVSSSAGVSGSVSGPAGASAGAGAGSGARICDNTDSMGIRVVTERRPSSRTTVNCAVPASGSIVSPMMPVTVPRPSSVSISGGRSFHESIVDLKSSAICCCRAYLSPTASAPAPAFSSGVGTAGTSMPFASASSAQVTGTFSIESSSGTNTAPSSVGRVRLPFCPLKVTEDNPSTRSLRERFSADASPVISCTSRVLSSFITSTAR